jgi:hypothetical protein
LLAAFLLAALAGGFFAGSFFAGRFLLAAFLLAAFAGDFFAGGFWQSLFAGGFLAASWLTSIDQSTYAADFNQLVSQPTQSTHVGVARSARLGKHWRLSDATSKCECCALPLEPWGPLRGRLRARYAGDSSSRSFREDEVVFAAWARDGCTELHGTP